MNFETFMNRKIDDLTQRFLDLKKAEFEHFCQHAFEEYQQDYADYLYEMQKDKCAEAQQDSEEPEKEPEPMFDWHELD